jgi:hypothetical protein
MLLKLKRHIANASISSIDKNPGDKSEENSN